jgi:hypothetical protein
MIVGQNSLLNQYVPTFYIKDLVDGQTIQYDSTRRAFVNVPVPGVPGATRLGELINVSNAVDVPVSVTNKQALVWNSFTLLWENQFIDYANLLNTPVTLAPANQIVFGNPGGTGYASNANFTYDPVAGILTLAGTKTLTVNSVTATISATELNSDISLLPNGAGSVIVGPVGAGVIQSSTGTSLTVRGNSTVRVEASAGGIIMLVSGTIANKVTVSGPTAAQYATGLADGDLVNKYYVDNTFTNPAGTIKAVSATVTLTTSITNIGALLPAGATILQVKVNVLTVDTASGTMVVGKSGNTSAYMPSTSNVLQTVDLYVQETMVTEAGAVQVIATCSGCAAGTAKVLILYQV